MRGLALLGFALVACSADQAASIVSPTPSPVSEACTLPVLQSPPGMSDEHSQFGFVTFPGGVFAPAPDVEGLYYDKPLGRWVQSLPPFIAPDGLHYGYEDSRQVHLVDARTGSDRVIASLDWEASAVGIGQDAFFVRREGPTANFAAMGLWEVPFDGRPPVQLTNDSRRWMWVSGGAVYGEASVANESKPNDIVRLDLSTRRLTVWFDEKASTRVLGVDEHGDGFVTTWAYNRSGLDFASVWRVSASGAAIQLWSGYENDLHPFDPLAFDSSGAWLSSTVDDTPASAIFHWSPAAGLVEVAKFADHWIHVAGPCV